MLSSYSRIHTINHKLLRDVNAFPINDKNTEIVIQEKIDGSQISFGKIGGVLKIRSRNTEIDLENSDHLFREAVRVIKDREKYLLPNVIYRGEYLQTENHNTLKYDRIPQNHIILFDIERLGWGFYCLEYLQQFARHLHLEVVPQYYQGPPLPSDQVEEYLKNTSILGGCKIEGVVLKNYSAFTIDDKVAMAKIVSTKFKELHRTTWRHKNPHQNDIIRNLTTQLRTEARWRKAVQHLRDDNTLTNSPKDIGPIIKEIQRDTFEEEYDFITKTIWIFIKNKLAKNIVSGVPEWYKNLLEEKSTLNKKEA